MQVQGQFYFILRIESEGVHVAGVDVVRFALKPLVYVFHSGGQLVAAAQTEDTFDVSVVVAHLLAGYLVARQIAARFLEVHIIRREIVRVEFRVDVGRTVYHVLHAGAIGIGLVSQVVGIGVFLHELAFAFGIVGGILRTAGFVIIISTARVERQFICGIEHETLVYGVGVETYGSRTSGFVAVLVDVVVLPASCLTALVGSVRGELARIDIGIDAFRQASFAGVVGVAGYVYGVPGIVRDDVDNAAYGIASVQGGCCAVQYLDALDVGHVDARVAVFACQTLAVFQYQYVVLVDAVQAHGSAHAVGVGRYVGRQFHQRFFQRGYVGAAYFFGRDYGDGNGAVRHAAVRTGSGHYHLAEVAVTLFQLYEDVGLLSVRSVFSGGEADVGEAQRVLSARQVVDGKFSSSVGGASRQTVVYADIYPYEGLVGAGTHHFSAQCGLGMEQGCQAAQHGCQ